MEEGFEPFIIILSVVEYIKLPYISPNILTVGLVTFQVFKNVLGFVVAAVVVAADSLFIQLQSLFHFLLQNVSSNKIFHLHDVDIFDSSCVLKNYNCFYFLKLIQ